MSNFRLPAINTNYRLHQVLRICFHIAALGGLLNYGLRWQGTLILFVSYAVSMLSITIGYHRYFSHRSFELSRFSQCVLGFVGCNQLQGGPIAWSAVHRHHHRYSDKKEDLHSPLQGFYRAHMGWLLNSKTYEVAFKPLKDLQRYPELVWLDRYNFIPAIIGFIFLWGIGDFYKYCSPTSIVDGAYVLFWGGFFRIVLVWHATWSVNSLCHIWGKQPFNTDDKSKNNGFIALLTMGEGWHNNHHKDPSSARSGLRWWQLDLSYYLIAILGSLGVVKKIHKPKNV